MSELRAREQRVHDDVLGDLVRYRVDGGAVVQAGRFETPSLQTLRERARNAVAGADATATTSTTTTTSTTMTTTTMTTTGTVTIANIVGNVVHLHNDPDNAGAVFQAASQFNCLEMVS